MFENYEQRAAAYAAFKYLEGMFDKQNRLKAGAKIDVSGLKVEITLPPGTIVARSDKEVAYHKASQNLNGWAVLATIVERLRKFNQWNIIRVALIDAVRSALKADKPTEDALTKADPELAIDIEKLKDELAVASREQVAPNRITRSDLPATITFRQGK